MAGLTRKIARLAALLVGWQPLLLAGVSVALVVLLSQLPFSCSFTMGKSRGPSSDLPFVHNFHRGESSEGGDERWRWSSLGSLVDLPGIGRRGVVVDMQVISHRAQWEALAEEGAALPDGVSDTSLTLRARDGPAFTFPLHLEGARYQVYLPPQALASGSLSLAVETPPWQNPHDRRETLGVAIGDTFRVESTRGSGFVLPDGALLVALLLVLVLLWWSLRLLSFSPNGAFWLLLPLAVGVPLSMLISAPRLAAGAQWMVHVGVLGVVAAGVCAWGVVPLLRRLDAMPPAALLRWLLLLLALTFVVKYGWRLYPESMPGDLQLHVNRATHTMQGRVYIEAQHRGLPFPFPNGPYLLLMPFFAAGLDLRMLLQLSLGVYEAVGVGAIYLLAARATESTRLGLFAAAVYALTSGGYMNTWFMFQTQVAAQSFAVVLLALLVVAWPRYHPWRTWGVLVVLFILIFLGHIGLFINTSLVGVLIVPLLWWRARSSQERRGVLWLLGAGVAAAAFVFAFYYSAFLGLITEQVVGVATRGMNEVTGRTPIPRETTLRVIWEGGLITHFGFFPVLLALPGSLILSGRRLRRSILPPLLWLTFLVSVSQAVLPLITLNSITTRWLMFSAWAVAVASAVGFARLWRRGRGGRVVVLAMAAYVVWLTLELNIEALVLRQPPIEPF